MRRMISETKAKVLDNLAVNKDGTVIEVGGNVALESIEQLGYIAPEGYTPVERVESEQEVCIFTSGNMYGTAILGQMYQYEKVGEWVEANRDDLPPDMQSLTLLAPAVSTDYSMIAFYDHDQDGTTKCWQTTNSKGYLKVSFFNAFNVPDNIMGSIKVYDKGGFKPFFTQKQYQDIINFINQ